MTFVLFGLYRGDPLEPEGIALEDPFAPSGSEGGDGFRYGPGAEAEGFWRRWMWHARAVYVAEWGWSWRAAFFHISGTYSAWGTIVIETTYPEGWRLDVDVLYEWYVEQRREGPFPGFEDPRLFETRTIDEQRRAEEAKLNRRAAEQRAWQRLRPRPVVE